MTPHESRVLVAASVGRDAALTADLLHRHGLGSVRCRDGADLAAAVAEGAGAAVVAEELLDRPTMVRLTRWRAEEPAWSDFPWLVFPAAQARSAGEALTRLGPLGNVTLLDRPLRMATLVSAVKTALRSRERQYQVRRLLGELEQGVVQRDRFLAMLGHELRNPLNAIVSANHVLDLLGRQDDFPQQERFQRSRDVIHRQGRALARLVDDLLDVARMTSGKLHVERVPVDMAEVAAHALETMRPAAEQHQVRMHARLVSALVAGDPTRLEQVLQNLLSNAIKYTPAGGRVDLTLLAPQGAVEVVVQDTGLGIDAEALPHVFEMFQQSEWTLDRTAGGLGVGLSLARALVDGHGGTIEAESPGRGRGSTFRVRLPALAAGAKPSPAPRPRARSVEGLHVVVVEDHEDSRVGLVELLEATGCRVDVAADGPAGVRAIRDLRPHLALVDIGLPGLDGYEVARHVRSAAGDAVYLVAVTGYGQDSDRRRALGAGFDRHVTKPWDLEVLQDLLERAATRAGLVRAPSADPAR